MALKLKKRRRRSLVVPVVTRAMDCEFSELKFKTLLTYLNMTPITTNTMKALLVFLFF